ncbi:MAG: tRNA uridine-5-carboxymethylaminomethyl(34) synthesis GTPase MnmE, partial [Clostridia bacterium]|nr:tRNA uridine-5-carboxymethylaminomethyl(34) synthesis GTPase MnmE [Clostridia bacterium]
KSHTIHFGTIEDNEDVIDEVLISIFKSPNSYTGEDAMEISCHASDYIQQRILETLIKNGASPATAGEFTFRAFMNGKFDLSQAEAVADLIASNSKASHKLALDQMRGGYSGIIKELRRQLVDFASLIELELDFSEEDVEFADRSKLLNLLDKIDTEVKKLIESFKLGNVMKHGIPVAIIGKPNVGKSTLLNAILNEEKAIVSDIPGTTRDVIEDTIAIDGLTFRFIDTAGLRDAADKIESIGIERTKEKIKQAAIVLYVFDISTTTIKELEQVISEYKELIEDENKKMILIANKIDQLVEIPHGFTEFVELDTLFISAKRKENIHEIAEYLNKSVNQNNVQDQTIVSNIRHYESLSKVTEDIEKIKNGFEQGLPSDLLTIDIRDALYYLGEITGEVTTDEILGNIFGKFCIGK